ncbi:IucA/IucC family protein [Flexibacterium corallicola]|uniref:IucA/IucC family protein n=1 Tax=Flexibacterium corallicola TaxID=3037259 RepID=UPI00286F3E8A|nr:IucA/IucC family protein [Pseudovibrio sp. M1P-2-3]
MSDSEKMTASELEWGKICRASLAKLISELSFEEVLKPVTKPEEDGAYHLLLSSGISYSFSAKVGIWGNLVVNGDSIRRTPDNDEPACPQQFTIDARTEMGMSAATEATFLRELANTLRQDLVLLQRTKESAGEDILPLPAHERQSLLAGHPKAVANKGRLGWSIPDLEQYAPEYHRSFKLLWIAAKRGSCKISESLDSNETDTLTQSLGSAEFNRLHTVLHEQGLGLESHVLIPVHPWQWDHVIQQSHLVDIQRGNLIMLGEFGDSYVSGPSLRTLVNIDRPGSPDIKVALTILNTSAYRGIPGKYIAKGGKLSLWLHDTVQADSFLKDKVLILQEQRGVWFEHSIYAQAPHAPYQHHESLGVIWRENVAKHLAEGQQACLYAELLHEDTKGIPLAVYHAQKSGLSIEDWLTQLFKVTAAPLYHFLAKYGVGFIAHGQNITVTMQNHVPVGIAIKDLQGDCAVVDQVFPEHSSLSQDLRDNLPQKPAHYIIHDIQTAHFASLLRFFSAGLNRAGIIDEETFYAVLGSVLQQYMAEHEALAERFALFDLFTPTMAKVCINKVRFAVGYEDNAERPLPALGTDLHNPIYLTNKVLV